MRLLIYTLALLVLFVPLYVGLGIAIDAETRTQERVLFTRDGVTLDCNRTVGVGGRVFYTHCVQVP